jgi:hypothetical protein
VFRRLGFVLRHPECEAVAACAPGAVERVLKLLRVRLLDYEKQHPQDRSAAGNNRCGVVRLSRTAAGMHLMLRHAAGWFEDPVPAGEVQQRACICAPYARLAL